MVIRRPVVFIEVVAIVDVRPGGRPGRGVEARVACGEVAGRADAGMEAGVENQLVAAGGEVGDAGDERVVRIGEVTAWRARHDEGIGAGPARGRVEPARQADAVIAVVAKRVAAAYAA